MIPNFQFKLRHNLPDLNYDNFCSFLILYILCIFFMTFYFFLFVLFFFSKFFGFLYMQDANLKFGSASVQAPWIYSQNIRIVALSRYVHNYWRKMYAASSMYNQHILPLLQKIIGYSNGLKMMNLNLSWLNQA